MTGQVADQPAPPGWLHYAGRRFGSLTIAWALAVLLVWTAAGVVGQRPVQDGDPRAASVRSPVEVLTAWDGQFYRSIAEHGYPVEGDGRRSFAFFPLYPVLSRLAGGDTHAALGGIIVSQLSLLAGMLLLSVLARGEHVGPLHEDPALWLLVAPVGFFFHAMYTESVFLLLTVGAALAFARSRFAITFALCFFAGLTRPTAITLAVPFFVAAVLAWRRRERWHGPLLCSAGPVSGIATYVVAVGFLMDDPVAYTNLQATYWENSFDIPFRRAGREAFDTAYAIKHGLAVPAWRVLRLSTVVVTGLLVVWGWRRIPLPWLAYVIASLAFIHAIGTGRSTTRYELVLFPVFVLMATSVLAKPKVAPIVLGASAALQLYFLVQFGEWEWVGLTHDSASDPPA
jgi:hypothetical protein